LRASAYLDHATIRRDVRFLAYLPHRPLSWQGEITARRRRPLPDAARDDHARVEQTSEFLIRLGVFLSNAVRDVVDLDDRVRR